MTDKWRLIADMGGVYHFPIELVGMRYAPVPALVLDPIFDHKAFDDPARLRDALPSTPADAVAL